jgi:hypothetical protein
MHPPDPDPGGVHSLIRDDGLDELTLTPDGLFLPAKDGTKPRRHVRFTDGEGDPGYDGSTKVTIHTLPPTERDITEAVDESVPDTEMDQPRDFRKVVVSSRGKSMFNEANAVVVHALQYGARCRKLGFLDNAPPVPVPGIVENSTRDLSIGLNTMLVAGLAWHLSRGVISKARAAIHYTTSFTTGAMNAVSIQVGGPVQWFIFPNGYSSGAYTKVAELNHYFEKSNNPALKGSRAHVWAEDSAPEVDLIVYNKNIHNSCVMSPDLSECRQLLSKRGAIVGVYPDVDHAKEVKTRHGLADLEVGPMRRRNGRWGRDLILNGVTYFDHRFTPDEVLDVRDSNIYDVGAAECYRKSTEIGSCVPMRMRGSVPHGAALWRLCVITPNLHGWPPLPDATTPLPPPEVDAFGHSRKAYQFDGSVINSAIAMTDTEAVFLSFDTYFAPKLDGVVAIMATQNENSYVKVLTSPPTYHVVKSEKITHSRFIVYSQWEVIDGALNFLEVTSVHAGGVPVPMSWKQRNLLYPDKFKRWVPLVSFKGDSVVCNLNLPFGKHEGLVLNFGNTVSTTHSLAVRGSALTSQSRVGTGRWIKRVPTIDIVCAETGDVREYDLHGRLLRIRLDRENGNDGVRVNHLIHHMTLENLWLHAVALTDQSVQSDADIPLPPVAMGKVLNAWDGGDPDPTDHTVSLLEQIARTIRLTDGSDEPPPEY